jgi:hypothetical protein
MLLAQQGLICSEEVQCVPFLRFDEVLLSHPQQAKQQPVLDIEKRRVRGENLAFGFVVVSTGVKKTVL